MALASTTQWMVRNGGSDTVCGGAFDPGQTAGMFTDGAAAAANTSLPVFSSASYNFQDSDVNAYVFIGAGTNWTLGWYKITGVSAGTAFLSALAEGYRPYGGGYVTGVNTADGCASVASPTGATWSIDYSQQDAAEVAFTDIACAGAGLTFSSATNPVGKQWVGNSVVVTGGDANITPGIYTIASVAAGVATVLGAANISTGAVTTGTGYLGGAMASIGRAGQYHVSGNDIWLQTHASPFVTTVNTSNVAGGYLTLAAGATNKYTTIRGFDQFPGDQTGNRPTIKAGVTCSYLVVGASRCHKENFIIDGNRASYTTGGYSAVGGQGNLTNIKFMNCASVLGLGNQCITLCEFTNMATVQSFATQQFRLCYWHDNPVGALTTSGSSAASFDLCIFDTNAGPHITSTGSSFGLHIRGCTFYGASGGNPAISFTSPPLSCVIEDNIFEANTDYGIKTASTYAGIRLLNNAFYNNTNGPYNSGFSSMQVSGTIRLSASPFVDAANGDFRLAGNSAGKQLKSAGYAQNFPGLTWTNYPALGAASPQSTGVGDRRYAQIW